MVRIRFSKHFAFILTIVHLAAPSQAFHSPHGYVIPCRKQVYKEVVTHHKLRVFRDLFRKRKLPQSKRRVSKTEDRRPTDASRQTHHHIPHPGLESPGAAHGGNQANSPSHPSRVATFPVRPAAPSGVPLPRPNPSVAACGAWRARRSTSVSTASEACSAVHTCVPSGSGPLQCGSLRSAESNAHLRQRKMAIFPCRGVCMSVCLSAR